MDLSSLPQYSETDNPEITIVYVNPEGKTPKNESSTFFSTLKKVYKNRKVAFLLEIFFYCLCIGSFIAIPFVDKKIYNDDLQEWSKNNEECKCNFEYKKFAVMYCEENTSFFIIPNDKIHIVGNVTCYNDQSKPTQTITYNIPEYSVFSAINRPGPIVWLIFSIILFVSTLLISVTTFIFV